MTTETFEGKIISIQVLNEKRQVVNKRSVHAKLSMHIHEDLFFSTSIEFKIDPDLLLKENDTIILTIK
jgi:hypothetical protein